MSTVSQKENMLTKTVADIQQYYTDNPHSHHAYRANADFYELWEEGNVGTTYDHYQKNSDGDYEYLWTVAINNPLPNLLD